MVLDEAAQIYEGEVSLKIGCKSAKTTPGAQNTRRQHVLCSILELSYSDSFIAR